ncbi:hypothetical protein GLIP_0857 [Aliiglaciecola lipolytica E3]|uniref:Endonuclease III n=1 Tax=Aliiglaciecola lipolytica E3 TaxID=1127673 RepID=K6Y5I5_9ALTE|nr:hypothetical protein GLIP_0857 [Aliiglaciecola lipolytica E3]
MARKPRCGACIIEDLCEFKDKTEQRCVGYLNSQRILNGWVSV